MWFAFILVSLNHWKQPIWNRILDLIVVICFHFSIFEPLETAIFWPLARAYVLWFAFILVSLNHWKQHLFIFFSFWLVVICFHFSIFEPLETAVPFEERDLTLLWFAFILVSLNHWKQPNDSFGRCERSCDLLSF